MKKVQVTSRRQSISYPADIGEQGALIDIVQLVPLGGCTSARF
jgi:hypothetical protein